MGIVHNDMGSALINTSEVNSLLVPLSNHGLGMVEEGLLFQYRTYEIVRYIYGPIDITIPYAELIPLLRPDSPVARMLRQRGLWSGVWPKR